MTAYYPVVDVLPEWAPETEGMGSKPKFWYLPPGDAESYWLFKYPRAGRGEHWAEKIAAEVAGLLEVDCARVELATFQDERGSATESITGGKELLHGNQVLNSTFAADDLREWNFHLADHTLTNIWLALDGIFDTSGNANEAKLRLAGYLVLDAVVGNTDRHSENWGILQSQDEHRGVERLAPSYDHGSSLGRELMDERRQRYLTDNRIGDYVERGRGQIYWQNVGRRGPSPLELIRLAAPEYPDLFSPALARLDNLDEPSLRQIVDSIPEDWMTPTARAFAFELMRYSCGQLREVI